MAIFESSVKRQAGTRSNMKLVVSGGASPAGQWVTDPKLPISFEYQYGGAGQKEVVVAKVCWSVLHRNVLMTTL